MADESEQAERQSSPEPIAQIDGPVLREVPASWPNVETERAQPGDVLGIERDGETTELGDTAESEDERRRTTKEKVEETAEG